MQPSLLDLTTIIRIKNGSIVHKVDTQLNELIKDIFYFSLQTYGTRRIREALLRKYGLAMSLKK